MSSFTFPGSKQTPNFTESNFFRLQEEKERIEKLKESAKFDAKRIQENREYTPAARSYSQEFTKQFLTDPSIPDTEDMERINGSLTIPEMEEIMPDINAPFSGKIK